MKGQIFFCYFVFFAFLSSCILLKNETQSEKILHNNENKIILSNLNQKLYESIDNPLQIYIKDLEYDSIFIFSPFAEYRYLSDRNYFFLNPNKSGEIWVILYAYKDDDCIYKDSLFINVNPLPNPVLVLPIRDNKLVKNALLQLNKLRAIVINLSVDIVCEVQSFEIITFSNGIMHKSLCESAYLSEEQKDILRKLNNGDYIVFYNILITMPNGLSRAIPSLVYEIVE